MGSRIFPNSALLGAVLVFTGAKTLPWGFEGVARCAVASLQSSIIEPRESLSAHGNSLGF
jgi:hypothetical protein